MKRCVIIGAAPIDDYESVRRYLDNADMYIYCDGGLYHEQSLGVAPTLIIGDFDSHPVPHRDIETITLPCVKDDTDSMFAVKTALSRGCDDFVFLGMTGGRSDHTLCNLSLLLFLDEKSCRAVMADSMSETSVVSDSPVYIEKGCRFFSIITADGNAHGVTVKGAKYPLDNADILCDNQYCISNEVTDNRACVSVRDGKLFLIIIK